MKGKFLICVDNKGYEASLGIRKLYDMIPDQDAQQHNQVRIIDESGEDYLYPNEFFAAIRLPGQTKNRIVKRVARLIWEVSLISEVTPEIIRETRENLHLSRLVFAHELHVSPRTLEKWEQGRTKPNDQAATLIMLVRKFPDTLQRLKEVAG